ncbi:glucosyltransferase domain-containing protein [Oceanobacillus longus]|uniref:Glucosyltransferase domain-containing protein n=1 Tax=Oceanobacillus longus TaxID=930120 RepID=A0ABV8H1V1_9BACI
MPEDLLENIYLKIKKRWKIAFFSAVIIGFLTHLFVMTNSLPNHDGVNNYYDPQMKFSSGRFFLNPFAGISSYFDLPLINGLLGILYLSLLSVVLVEIFKLRKTLSIVLMAGLIVTFPTIASTFSYMFTADGYMFSFFTTALAVLLTIRFKYGFLPGAILFYLSVGVYQANLPLAVSVVALWFMKELLYGDEKLKSQIISLGKQVVMVVLGMIAYVVTYKLYQGMRGITGYQGLDSAGSVSLQDIPGQLYLLIREFIKFFIDDNPNLFELLNVGVIGLILIGGILILMNRYKAIGYMKTLFIIISALLLPVFSLLLYFISPDVKYHMLMVMSLVVFYFIPLIVYDSIRVNNLMTSAYSWSTVIILALTVFNFTLISNISYLNMNLKYERTYALANRVLDRIEQTENIEDVNKIAILGKPQNYAYSPFSSTLARSVPPMTGALGSIFIHDSNRFSNMFDQYLGIELDGVTNRQIRELENNSTVNDMGSWPAADSVVIIDDMVIVKFQED